MGVKHPELCRLYSAGSGNGGEAAKPALAARTRPLYTAPVCLSSVVSSAFVVSSGAVSGRTESGGTESGCSGSGGLGPGGCLDRSTACQRVAAAQPL